MMDDGMDLDGLEISVYQDAMNTTRTIHITDVLNVHLNIYI